MFRGRKAFEYWQGVDHSPSASEFFLSIMPRIILRHGLPTGTISGSEMRRLYDVVSLTAEPDLDPVEPPPIEIVIKVVSQEIGLLAQTVSSAIKASVNPVTQVVLIPNSRPEVEACWEASVAWKNLAPTQVVALPDLVGQQTLKLIENEFPTRAGWVGQQVGKAWAGFSSKSSGVLIVDADTLLLRRRQFLDRHGQQLLLPVLERHGPYRRHLECLWQQKLSSQHSFVSHHLLIQPKNQRKIFADLLGGVTAPDDFVAKITSCSAERSGSMMCIDYEMYAHGILQMQPEKVRFAKWSNISIQRRQRDKHVTETVQQSLSNQYYSASSHHYLGFG